MKRTIIVFILIIFSITFTFSAQKKNTTKNGDVNIEFNFTGDSTSEETDLENVEDEAKIKTKKVTKDESESEYIVEKETDGEKENVKNKKKRIKEADEDSEDVVVIKEKENSKEKKSKFKFSDTNSMIKMGKSLTFGGAAGLIIGSLCIGIGTGTVLGAMFYSGVGNLFSDWNSSKNWQSILSGLSGNFTVVGLLAATCVLWTLGGVLMFLSFMMIPGIIIWARGVHLDSKKKVSMSLSGVQNGMALSIKF